ncbi:phosphatidate cytidylyltransferase [Caenispirillum bisanense]|uniref:phosphatidate cytidylyltransferase n=1 Tax=Caenispirillum bisanense TaxID=414052 RepID=UPI0031D41EC4
MLKTRLLSALIMIPLALLCVWAGSPVFDLAVAAIALLMAWEWQAMVQPGHRLPGWAAGFAAAIATLAVVPLPLWALAVVVVAPVPVFLLALSRPAAGWAALGAVYVALPAVALVWLREEGGLATVLWLMFVVWATDTGAYAFGKRIGGPKLAPRISPKKTWAGLWGGAFSAAVVGLVTALIVNPGALVVLTVFSAALAIIEQISDLSESYVKRRFGVKDSGTIIPGHGGVLDRVDGLVLAAPAVVLAVLLGQGGITAW